MPCKQCTSILKRSRKNCCFQIIEQFGIIERLRNENEDKTKTQMTQSFNQYTENETTVWRQNILNQFNRVSSSCLRSQFVISLMFVNETWHICLVVFPSYPE